jgi:hypothetical protein
LGLIFRDAELRAHALRLLARRFPAQLGDKELARAVDDLKPAARGLLKLALGLPFPPPDVNLLELEPDWCVHDRLWRDPERPDLQAPTEALRRALQDTRPVNFDKAWISLPNEIQPPDVIGPLGAELPWTAWGWAF